MSNNHNNDHKSCRTRRSSTMVDTKGCTMSCRKSVTFLSNPCHVGTQKLIGTWDRPSDLPFPSHPGTLSVAELLYVPWYYPSDGHRGNAIARGTPSATLRIITGTTGVIRRSKPYGRLVGESLSRMSRGESEARQAARGLVFSSGRACLFTVTDRAMYKCVIELHLCTHTVKH